MMKDLIRHETIQCVISNSSPLMNLAIIGQLDLVKTLFGRILVPQEVWHELTVAGKGKPGNTVIRQAEWIEHVELEEKTLYPLLRKDLDDGEAAAIACQIGCILSTGKTHPGKKK